MSSKPTRSQWRALYNAAIRLKELAPWEWMQETDIFGIKDPKSDQIGYISIMGQLGEHYALSLYLNSEGFYGFWELQNGENEIVLESFLEIPQLQLSFENEEELKDEDKKIIEDLGYTFNGEHEWPMFRSYKPGYAPWFLTAKEADFFKIAIEQSIDVAIAFQHDPSLLSVDDDDDKYLVRVKQKKDRKEVWTNTFIKIPDSEPLRIPIDYSEKTMESIKKKKKSNQMLELDFSLFLSPIHDGPQPYYAYMLILMDAKSAEVIGHELLTQEPTREDMLGSLPQKVLELLTKLETRPSEIRIRSNILYQLLEDLADELDIYILETNSLPCVNFFKEQFYKKFKPEE
ncbi:hypothetical protein GF407_15335 [candidate division KSB1 bacterium]|nr:hypothetical protein [candidate division KSB1 bacterium]